MVIHAADARRIDPAFSPATRVSEPYLDLSTARASFRFALTRNARAPLAFSRCNRSDTASRGISWTKCSVITEHSLEVSDVRSSCSANSCLHLCSKYRCGSAEQSQTLLNSTLRRPSQTKSFFSFSQRLRAILYSQL